MTLHFLDNRRDRMTWRLICGFTNSIYLAERESRKKEYSERRNVDLQSDEAPLLTPADFRTWTSVCYRSTENAFLSARLLWSNLDGSQHARERIDYDRDENSFEADTADGYESIDGDFSQHEVETARQAVVDTLRIYVGDQEFEMHLRALVHTERNLERYDMLWAHSLFDSWIHSHPIHDMSTFSIALLLMERYICDGQFDNDAVLRMRALLGEHRFRAFFHNCLSGDNEKIFAALQVVQFLNEPDQWLIQDGITILQYRGYSARTWKDVLSARHCRTDTVSILEEELQNVVKIPAGQGEVDPLLVLDAIAPLGLAKRDVIDLFRQPFEKGNIQTSSLFSNNTTRQILRAQGVAGDQNNLLLSRDRMKFLGMACGLLSKVYHDLMIKARDASTSVEHQEYLDAAREQKMQMDVHLVEWEATVDQKGYPSSWRNALPRICNNIEERDHELWEGGYSLQRKFEDTMIGLGDAKDKAFEEIREQKQLAEKLWGTTTVGHSSDDFRSWQMEWAEGSFAKLEASLRYRR